MTLYAKLPSFRRFYNSFWDIKRYVIFANGFLGASYRGYLLFDRNKNVFLLIKMIFTIFSVSVGLRMQIILFECFRETEVRASFDRKRWEIKGMMRSVLSGSYNWSVYWLTCKNEWFRSAICLNYRIWVTPWILIAFNFRIRHNQDSYN